MARCDHGFEPSGPAGVKCPMGCHGYVPKSEAVSESTQAQLVTRTRAITNQQIVDALNERGTLNAAASHLGINPGTIIVLALLVACAAATGSCSATASSCCARCR